MLHKLQGQCPRDSAQGQATLRKADPQKEEEESCHEQSAGGEAEAGEYSAAHQLYGEGRRGGSGGKRKQTGKFTGEEVEEKTKTISGRKMKLKSGKLIEGEGTILPLVMKDLSLI